MHKKKSGIFVEKNNTIEPGNVQSWNDQRKCMCICIIENAAWESACQAMRTCMLVPGN